jgi:hypothetical protein
MHVPAGGQECPVWGPLLASPETLDGMTHEALSRALVAQDRDAHALLIDSTKTAWRSPPPFRLAGSRGADFTLCIWCATRARSAGRR